jgi:hypothetical protein
VATFSVNARFNGAAKESLFYQSDDKRRGGPITAAPISFHPVMANEQVTKEGGRRGWEEKKVEVF